ncbi:MAG TPA: transporter [Thermoanaerobaculia bacterium]|nr:transporter [Thermoanaerobaculia bacterium]
MRISGLLATLAGLALAVPTYAQNLSGLPDPLVADRPDFTESTQTIEPGHVQVESGFTFSRFGEEESQSLGEVLARIGVGERVEARLGVGSYGRIDPGFAGAGTVSGYEDPFVGLKVRLNESDPDLRPPGRPAMSLLFSTSIPVGDDELTADEWQPEAKLLLAWDLPWFSLSSNLIYGYPVDGDDRFHQFGATLSASFALTDRIGMFVETFGFDKESANGSSTQYVDGGVSFSVFNDLQLDARVGFGLDDPSPNWFAGIGAAVRF